MEQEQYEYFITCTFDPAVIDSCDKERVKAAWNKFSDKCKRDNLSGHILSLLERSPGKKFWHYHAFVSGIDLKLTPCKFPDGKPVLDLFGKQMYNVGAWPYGYAIAAEYNNGYISSYLELNDDINECERIRKLLAHPGGQVNVKEANIQKA